MVICIIALPVFAILGLFSLKYRLLAWEAFHCLFRTIAFKPCNTGLDQRIKSKFSTKLMWWPSLARGFYKYFEILSWIFVILMISSAAVSGYGLYNYIKYGNCNGDDSSAFCIFNVGPPSPDETRSVFGVEGKINTSNVKIGGYPSKGTGEMGVLHEYGCYSCPYTKEAEQVVSELLEDYSELKFVYHNIPLEIHNYSVDAGEAAICAGNQEKYWEYHDLLLDRIEEFENESFVEFALELGLNISEFNECLSSNETLNKIEKSRAEAVAVGIYGTPTFIFEDESLVGPQSYKTLKNLIR